MKATMLRRSPFQRLGGLVVDTVKMSFLDAAQETPGSVLDE